jgi:hypothetical protein
VLIFVGIKKDFELFDACGKFKVYSKLGIIYVAAEKFPFPANNPFPLLRKSFEKAIDFLDHGWLYAKKLGVIPEGEEHF